MKFNSQVCTDKNQSERLLALGLKKQTADIEICCLDGEIRFLEEEDYQDTSITIPAWSLHRLIEMISEEIQTDWQSMCLQDKGFTKRDNLYDNIVDCIEWLIKEGYFPKEYLV